MRINKYISSTGFCSRREADKLIEGGSVKINDEVALLGSIVNEGDRVTINDEPLKPERKFIYIALNKPRGIVSTTERQIEGNIIDFLQYKERIFPIGRLDKDSEGLILLTSDGDIVNKILRSENDHEKEYIVTVDKAITEQFIKDMSSGVILEGRPTKRCRVWKVDRNTFRIILTEGRNRQIRRMCAKLGVSVVFLKRVRIMNIHLNSLNVGEWRYLTDGELNELFNKLNYHPLDPLEGTNQ